MTNETPKKYFDGHGQMNPKTLREDSLYSVEREEMSPQDK